MNKMTVVDIFGGGSAFIPNVNVHIFMHQIWFCRLHKFYLDWAKLCLYYLGGCGDLLVQWSEAFASPFLSNLLSASTHQCFFLNSGMDLI